MKNVVIFANGEWLDGFAVQRILAESAHTIAADGGGEQAYRLKRHISILVGDMDSISPQTLDTLTRQGCEILRHPPDKNETDLELALLVAAERGAVWIRVLGALGRRLDQTLANVYLLNLPALAGLDVALVAANQTVKVLAAGEHPLMGEIGDTVSLIPLGGAVNGISTYGMKYTLQHESLELGPARGISNVISQEFPRITIAEGRLLMIHTIGRA